MKNWKATKTLPENTGGGGVIRIRVISIIGCILGRLKKRLESRLGKSELSEEIETATTTTLFLM